ncbi:MAG: saccharopine dehydrogenase NADP-binding domain-containing protein [Bacteroidota bacterium]
MKDQREFDVIIWGATGFTGRLVAEYMLEKYGTNGDVKWAMAARNAVKLEKVQDELGASAVPVVIADSNKMDTLERMVKRTKVVCTTVGPYAKYGTPLVEACVQHQTDYCDLAGEVPWMRRMIDAHHETAKANGARIVHTCGFDSIPSDMGVYFLQKKAKEKKGAYCEAINMRVKVMKGGMSGGTYASMGQVMVEARADKSIFKTLNNPYGLNPDPSDRGLDKRDLTEVIYDEDTQSWIAPFVMAGINTRVVRRSHALAGFPYGKNFKYDEAMMMGKGFAGRAKGNVLRLGMGAVMLAKPGSLVKNVIDRFLPKPGEGPSEEERENGFYKILFIGKYADGDIIKGVVTGDRDPGYGSTSKMLAECAVCLAKDKDKTPKVAGMLTPSVAFGDVLLERLENNAGLKFIIP